MALSKLLATVSLFLQSFVIALQFLTRLPIPVRVEFNTRTVSRSLLFYPLTGIIIGSIVSAAVVCMPLDTDIVNSVLLLFIWTIASGGLHLDGLMDTADGLGSMRSPSRMLEIMKDSRVGAFGVLAAFFILLMKWAALTWLLSQLKSGKLSEIELFYILLLVPAMSRWWMAAAVVHWPYVGGSNGLGSYYSEAGKSYTFLSALPAAAVLIYLLPALKWLILPGIQLVLGLVVIRMIIRRLGGLTGDSYGALNEAVEAAGLLCAVYISVQS